MRIRAAVEQDLAAVLRLERETDLAPHWAAGDYETIVRGGGVRRCLFLAEAGELVGFGVGKAVGDEGEVESVAVTARARRQGVGAALLAAVVEWCRGEGARVVDLEVRAGSEEAVRLYQRAGFVEVGRRGGYYRLPVEDALMMRLTP